MADTLKAKYIPTGETVMVYKHKERATFVDTKDYTTEYKKETIELL